MNKSKESLMMEINDELQEGNRESFSLWNIIESVCGAGLLS